MFHRGVITILICGSVVCAAFYVESVVRGDQGVVVLATLAQPESRLSATGPHLVLRVRIRPDSERMIEPDGTVIEVRRFPAAVHTTRISPDGSHTQTIAHMSAFDPTRWPWTKDQRNLWRTWQTPIHWCAAFPGWVPVVVLAAYPVVAFVRRGLRRSHAGRHVANVPCAVCAYNLTGNTSGVCPECGTKVPA